MTAASQADEHAYLDIVDSHLTDLALCGVANLLSSSLLSWDDVAE